jgi:type IV pilus assembly protein PilQ
MNSTSPGSINPPARSASATPGRRGAATLLFLLCGVLCLLPIAQGRAANELRDVQYSSLPGNQVRIDLIFSAPVDTPRTFATDSPARIALDMPGVTSGLENKSVPIDIGPVQSLVAVEGSDRTRVVVNLTSAVPYNLSTSGNRVSLSINSAAVAAAPAPAAPRRTASRAAAGGGPGVRDIDFRRGPNGEGRVLITLPTPTTRVSVTEKGRRVIVAVQDAALPSRLLRRLDVVDFGTPVVAVESRPKGRDVEVAIETGADYEYLAFQADQLFTVELRPLTPAQKQQQLRDKVVYSGDRLSLNFQDIEVRAVLQLLADFTGLNLVASDTVRGNITLRLKNVPWDQALDIILKTKGLSMRQTGNVIMVAPTQEIAAQEKLELEANQQIEDLAPLRSEFVQINYAKASDLVRILKAEENQLLSERGNVAVDDRTNTLLVQDTSTKLEDIRRIVTELDRPVKQVAIESRVVIANNDFARELGVRFGYSNLRTNANTGEFREFFGGQAGTFDADGYWGSAIDDTIPLIVDLPVNDPSGAVNFLIGKVGSYLLQLELSALQREGRGEIISSPRVITSDQKKATIKLGQEIPYQEESRSGGTTVSFKEAVLQLDVTPQITPDDRIIMDLRVNKDNPDFTREVNGVPPIDTREVETSVLVDNGETVVLGGVYEREKSFQREQVPWLGDLPVVGTLFRTTARQDDNRELLIFVTPKILKEGLSTDALGSGGGSGVAPQSQAPSRLQKVNRR